MVIGEWLLVVTGYWLLVIGDWWTLSGIEVLLVIADW